MHGQASGASEASKVLDIKRHLSDVCHLRDKVDLAASLVDDSIAVSKLAEYKQKLRMMLHFIDKFVDADTGCGFPAPAALICIGGMCCAGLH